MGTQNEIAHLASSDAYQAKFRYRDTPRTSDDPRLASVEQWGHMLETLKDAVLILRQMDIEPDLDPSKDLVYRHLQHPSPAYIDALASQFLNASSFMRTDTGRTTHGVKHPDASAFMNVVHGLMRGQVGEVGKSWVVPEHLKEAISNYNAYLSEYQKLLDDYKDAVTGRRDYKLVPKERMDAFAAKFVPFREDFENSLKSLENIEINVRGTHYQMPNRWQVNDRLNLSYPAHVLFVYSMMTAGAADSNKRPTHFEYDKSWREIIGAQSMLTDTLQGLFDLQEAYGIPNGFDLNRKQLDENVKKYRHQFELLRFCCRTMDCGYPMMYEDLDRFIRMSGENPDEVPTLKNKHEVALSLYAIERGFTRHNAAPELCKSLRKYADEVESCASMDEVTHVLHTNDKLQLAVMRCKEVATHHQYAFSLPAIEILMGMCKAETITTSPLRK